MVVADPRSPRIQRDHERAGPLQVVQIPLPPESPVSKSASSPLTRSHTEVHSSNRRTFSLCRSSTSVSRYAASVRSLPENCSAPDDHCCRILRIALADSSDFGMNPATGASSIRSAKSASA